LGEQALRLGCFLPPALSLPDTLALARLAEELGYDSVRCSHIAGRDALTLMAACASATERIRLSTAVVPIYARTPASMAQATATLAELSGERFALGIGVSHRRGVEAWYGQTIDRPVAEMREYVGIVRAILAGDLPPTAAPDAPAVKWRTAFQLAGVGPFPRTPILGAALSPAMLRAVGELCDGAVLWLCVPSYIEAVVLPELAAGRARAGKTLEDFEVVAILPTAHVADRTAAYETLRAEFVSYLSLPFYRAMLERSGFGPELAAYDAADDVARRRAAISDAFLEALTAVGDEQAVRASVARYAAAGVGAPCLWPVAGTDPQAALRAAAP
jgi:alkanesulfonate monooxygenase SsuD/methylene tetrahydromethanopterin reductase-like flavin-dependent oxidoreductase (luciferase family)